MRGFGVVCAVCAENACTLCALYARYMPYMHPRYVCCMRGLCVVCATYAVDIHTICGLCSGCMCGICRMCMCGMRIVCAAYAVYVCAACVLHVRYVTGCVRAVTTTSPRLVLSLLAEKKTDHTKKRPIKPPARHGTHRNDQPLSLLFRRRLTASPGTKNII